MLVGVRNKKQVATCPQLSASPWGAPSPGSPHTLGCPLPAVPTAAGTLVSSAALWVLTAARVTTNPLSPKRGDAGHEAALAGSCLGALVDIPSFSS